MSQAQYLGPDHEFEGVAAAALPSGSVIVGPDGRHGVVTALTGFAIGQRYRATMVGRFSIAAVTANTFSVNDVVYWDDTAKNCTSTVGANTKIGRAAKAKLNGETVVEVYLNGQGPTV